MRFFTRDRTPTSVTILPSGRSFPATGKDSILNEALAAGIPFPHSCTVGTCGTCKSRLISGKVREITDAAIALSSQELKDRYILPCQSLARGAVELDVADLADMPDHPLVHTDGEMVGKRGLTHDILEVTVRVDEPFEYSAGQYAELTVDGLSGPRSYSFATGAADRPKDEFTFFVRRTPGGEFTEWLFAEDRTGTRLGVVGPFGNLWLRPSAVPVLCVAGGSGLAPIKSILEAARDDDVRRDFVFVFGARSTRDLYCLEESAALAGSWGTSYTFVPALSEEAPDSGWSGARGMVTDVLAGLPTELLTSCDAYVCGPPAMVDAVEQQLRALRPEGNFFHADRFLDKKTQRQG
ncbi:2Fe-2S iron-sulfur cluster-binding protein [Pseudonocardia petroleophila]|uniref:2Fe-2S iron-sulfur cluster binding domain-containing protein n=1 Tax=Pseudonocardia petroleophila TaxID=37331 RepID=A0A7G7MBU1_9PSEU|nr:2Fe-2S iron-sulfur cluster binding domain-containing protein [Pseudonocardia petroleophila]QNG50252.1 2Fe-2S iron-sulfur cluster binding domain-containing protein [Pseudonocardia petroleophila]